MPTFSIVIPCHDAAGTVAAALRSVQDQTVTDWEAICVDDGSTDGTLSVLRLLAAADARIRVVAQANAGPSRARNSGAGLATGEIVAFLDADDLWLPGKLASVAETFARDPQADAVFGRVAFFAEAERADTALSAPRCGPLALPECLGENPLCTLSNLSVRRDVFLASGGFDTALSHSEDLAWLVGAVAAGARVRGTDDLHLRYRASVGGLSSDLHAMHAGWRRAVRPVARALPLGTLRRAEARHLRYLARRALRMGAPAATARSFACRGMRLAPLAFLGGGYRGPATLAACLAAPLLPAALRHRAFS